jgi:hypothetical protein
MKRSTMPFDKLRRANCRPTVIDLGVSLRVSGIGALLIGGVMSEHAFRSRRATTAAAPGADARGDRRERSVRVVSAVELVEQPGQGDEAETEANQHEPPSEDGS